MRLPRERERESEGRGTVEYRAGGEITIFKASKKKKSLSIYLRTELIQFPSSMKQYLYHCSKICTFLFSSFVKKKKKRIYFIIFSFVNVNVVKCYSTIKFIFTRENYALCVNERAIIYSME